MKDNRDHFIQINGVWRNVRFMSHEAKLRYLGYQPRTNTPNRRKES